MDEHEWTTYDEPDQFQRCAVKPQLRMGQLGGISNEVPNFKIFTRILPKAQWAHKRVTNICKTMPHMSFPKVPSDGRL